MGIIRKPELFHENESRGVVFLPGLGQTKAGPYFLFSMLAQKISNYIPTLQFDYFGTGDSYGELTDVTLMSLYSDANFALEFFKNNKCENITLICSGIGNWIGTELANNLDYVSSVVLLSPWKSHFIDKIKVDFKRDIVDTSDLGDWTNDNCALLNFFEFMGGGLNRTKGLVLKTIYLNELISLRIPTIKRNIPILEIYGGKKETAINEYANCMYLENSEISLLKCEDRAEIIEKIDDWMNTKGEN